MEKHRGMEGEGKGDGHQHGGKPRIPELAQQPRNSPSEEVRYIGHQRALSPWINGWDGID